MSYKDTKKVDEKVSEKKDIKKVVKHVCDYIQFTTSDGSYYKCRCGNVKFSAPYR